MTSLKLKSDKITTTKSLGAVVIGTGGQGLRRAQAVRMAKGWHLAGIFDADTDRCHAAAKKCNCPSFETIEHAMSCNQADVIMIATPPASHDHLILQALEHGRHVLCEKPLTIQPELAEKNLRLAESRNLQIATGFNHRFFSPVIDLNNAIEAETIGKVLEIRSEIGEQLPDNILDGWHGNPLISGGGVLTDNGSHLIDLATLFLNNPRLSNIISFEMMAGRPGIDDHCEMELTDDDGLKATLTATWRRPAQPYLQMAVHGEKGVITISAFPWKLTLERPDKRSLVKNYLFDRLAMKLMGQWAAGLETSLIRELNQIRNSIINHDRNILTHATGRDGLTTARLIDKIRKQSAIAAESSASNIKNRQIA